MSDKLEDMGVSMALLEEPRFAVPYFTGRFFSVNRVAISPGDRKSLRQIIRQEHDQIRSGSVRTG